MEAPSEGVAAEIGGPSAGYGKRLEMACSSMDAIFQRACDQLNTLLMAHPNADQVSALLHDALVGAKRAAKDLSNEDREAALEQTRRITELHKSKVETLRVAHEVNQKEQAQAFQAQNERNLQLLLETRAGMTLSAAIERANELQREIDRLNEQIEEGRELQARLEEREKNLNDERRKRDNRWQQQVNTLNAKLREREAASESTEKQLVKLERAAARAQATASAAEEKYSGELAELQAKLETATAQHLKTMMQMQKNLHRAEEAAILRKHEVTQIRATFEAKDKSLADMSERLADSDARCEQLADDLEATMKKLAAGGGARETALLKAALSSLHQLRSHITHAALGLRARTPPEGTETLAYDKGRHRWGVVSTENNAQQFGKLVIRVEDTARPLAVHLSPRPMRDRTRRDAGANDDDGAAVGDAAAGSPAAADATVRHRNFAFSVPEEKLSLPTWRPTGASAAAGAAAEKPSPVKIGAFAAALSAHRIKVGPQMASSKSDPLLPAVSGRKAGAGGIKAHGGHAHSPLKSPKGGSRSRVT